MSISLFFPSIEQAMFPYQFNLVSLWMCAVVVISCQFNCVCLVVVLQLNSLRVFGCGSPEKIEWRDLVAASMPTNDIRFGEGQKR